jgi:hypothetical protein
VEHDFDVDLQINRFKLDEECERHAAVYHYWAEERTKAKAAVAQAEDSLEEIRADIQLGVNSEKDERCKAYLKVTVDVAKALVETHERVKTAKEVVREAKKTLNHLDACVYSLESRKYMLGNLVDLWVKSYYSAPKGSTPSASDDLQSDTRASLNARDRQRRERKQEDGNEEK